MANSTSTTSKKAKKKTKKTAKKVSKAVKKTAARKKPAAKAKRKTATASTAVRQRMIEEAAYFHAQQRNFATGHEMNDWLMAEIEVDKIINKQ